MDINRPRLFQSGDGRNQIVAPSSKIPYGAGVIRVRRIENTYALFFSFDLILDQENKMTQVGNERLNPFLNQHVPINSSLEMG
jgi:hypothetical protein